MCYRLYMISSKENNLCTLNRVIYCMTIIYAHSIEWYTVWRVKKEENKCIIDYIWCDRLKLLTIN